MRILLVHSYYRMRGGEDVVFEAEAEAEAEMLGSFGHTAQTDTRHNEELLDQGRVANFKNTIWIRSIADEIANIVRDQQIEIVHFHNTFPAISPTHYVRQRYEAAEYPISRVVVKPHFVECDLEPGDGRGGFALFVGRLSEEKGLRTLLDAWPKLSGRLPLKVIGQGPLEAELIAIANRNGSQVDASGSAPGV